MMATAMGTVMVAVGVAQATAAAVMWWRWW